MEDWDDAAVSIKESPFGGPAFVRTVLTAVDSELRLMQLRIIVNHSIDGTGLTSEFEALLSLDDEGACKNGRAFLDKGVDAAIHHAYQVLQSGVLDLDQEDDE